MYHLDWLWWCVCLCVCVLTVLVKGSAERLRGMLREVPHDYDTLHKSYSMQGNVRQTRKDAGRDPIPPSVCLSVCPSGYRILCMAAKWIDSSEVEGGYRHMDRKAIESGLVFAGRNTHPQRERERDLCVSKCVNQAFWCWDVL